MSRQAGEPGDAHLAEGLTQVPYVVFVYTETLGTKSEIGYSIAVEIEFDPAKDVANVEKHGVSLARAADLVPVAFVEDDRFEEPRYRV